MELKIKSLIALLLVPALLVGCANHRTAEKMEDLSSYFKDLATAIDGHIKFGDGSSMTNEQLITTALQGNPAWQTALEGYDIKLIVEGKNSMIMLCQENIALIEDTGCTENIDKKHWTSNNNHCEFTLNLTELCI